MNPSYAGKKPATARPPLPGAFYANLLATVCFSLGLTTLVPVIPLFITDELSAAEHWVGTATLFVAFTAVATRIPAGALSDRHGRRRIMLIGAALGVGASVLYTASRSLPVFLAARLITGASLSLFTTTNKAFAADLAPGARRAEAMGLNNGAFSLATVLSPLLSEGLMNAVSFQAVFALSGGLSLLALAVTFTLPAILPERSANAGAVGDIKEALRQRGTWAAIVLMLGLGTILALMFTFYPLLATRKELFADAPRLIASVAMGMGLSVWALTDTIVEPLAGRVADRVGRQGVALPGLLVAALGVLALSQAHNSLTAYVAIAVLATGWGAARAATDAISQDAVSPVLRGMGAAVAYTAFDIAVGADAQILSGLIDGSDFGALFQATLVLLLGFGLTGVLLATRLMAYDQRAATIAPGD